MKPTAPFWANPYWLLTILLLLFLAGRLVAIGSLPVVGDEAIHIEWSREIASRRGVDESLDFALEIMGRHGRVLQPLLLAPILRTSPLADLNTARALSTVAGASALVALFLAGRLLGTGAGILGAILYLLCPFAFLYDRMALSDGLLCALASWITLFSIRLASEKEWNSWRTIVLASLLALAIAAKIPGAVLFAYPLLALALGKSPSHRWRHGVLAVALGGLLGLPLLASFAGASHQGQFFVERESGLDLGSILGSVMSNIAETLRWLWAYWTPPVLTIALLAGLFAIVRRRSPETALAAFAALPILAFSLVATPRGLSPRYILFSTPAALLLVASAVMRTIDFVRPRLGGSMRAAVLFGAALLCLIPSIRFDFLLVSDPESAPFLRKDRSQYVTGLPSGFGARALARYLRHSLPGRCAAGARVLIWNRFAHTGVKFHLEDPLAAPPALKLYGQDAVQEKGLEQWLGSSTEPCVMFVRAQGSIPTKHRDPESIDLLAASAGRLVRSFPKPGGAIRLDLWEIDAAQKPVLRQMTGR